MTATGTVTIARLYGQPSDVTPTTYDGLSQHYTAVTFSVAQLTERQVISVLPPVVPAKAEEFIQNPTPFNNLEFYGAYPSLIVYVDGATPNTGVLRVQFTTVYEYEPKSGYTQLGEASEASHPFCIPRLLHLTNGMPAASIRPDLVTRISKTVKGQRLDT
jgi:hypothetical protein